MTIFSLKPWSCNIPKVLVQAPGSGHLVSNVECAGQGITSVAGPFMSSLVEIFSVQLKTSVD